jgi:hypothetical protein
MTVSSEARLKQVQRYGTALRRLCKFLFITTAVGGIAAIGLLVFSTSPDTSMLIGTATYTADTLTLFGRAVGVTTVVLGVGLVLRLCFHMIRLFDLYASGRIFTDENVRHMRQIGVTVFLFSAYWLVDLALQFVPPSALASSATREVMINLNIPFGIVILGTVIVFFSWIMDVGRELREEQDLVV